VSHPLLVAVAPLAQATGGTVVAVEAMEPGDVPLEWEGRVVGGFRPGSLHGALSRMLGALERQLDAPLASMTREQKQHAVRLLDEAGAFALRHGVEDVADALGVSRFTVYNYLNGRTGVTNPQPP
jgi:hypothetical protein